MRTRGTIVFVFTILAGLLVLPAGSSASDGPSHKAFNYTDEKVQMPDQWRKQPIKYEDWAKGADLAVTLDQHLYDVMLPLVKKYAREKKLDIAVKEGTCGISAGMLLKKKVDMAGFCCPAGRSDRLPGLEYRNVGIAPIAVIVHPSNPLDSVSIDHARGLFSGEIMNWSALPGGRDTTVKPVARLHCKARPGHWRLILDNEDLFSQDLLEVGNIPDMMISVSSLHGGVGHVATWNIKKFKDRSTVKVLSIDGMSPFDTGAIESGRYPFYRAYNIATWNAIGGRAEKLAHDLVGYLVENAGEIDPAFGMVPVSRLRELGWKFRGQELVGAPE